MENFNGFVSADGTQIEDKRNKEYILCTIINEYNEILKVRIWDDVTCKTMDVSPDVLYNRFMGYLNNMNGFPVTFRNISLKVKNREDFNMCLAKYCRIQQGTYINKPIVAVKIIGKNKYLCLNSAGIELEVTQWDIQRVEDDLKIRVLSGIYFDRDSFGNMLDKFDKKAVENKFNDIDEQSKLNKGMQGSDVKVLVNQDNKVAAFDGSADAKRGLLIIPNGVEIIQPRAFSNNDTIQRVNLPASVRVIGRNAFSGCKNLKLVKVNEGCLIIEQGAFEGCQRLEQIYIPDTVKEVRTGFNGCAALKKVEVSRGTIVKAMSRKFVLRKK